VKIASPTSQGSSQSTGSGRRWDADTRGIKCEVQADAPKSYRLESILRCLGAAVRLPRISGCRVGVEHLSQSRLEGSADAQLWHLWNAR
jgi:hypothetical protein